MVKHNFDNLKLLNNNKTVVFYSPIEGENILVRTGNEGSSNMTFFHSFMHSYSKKFNYIEYSEKSKMAEDLYKILIKKFWDKHILELSTFKELIIQKLREFYNFITTDDYINISDFTKNIFRILHKNIHYKFETYYIIIFDLISLKDIQNIIELSNSIETIKKYSEYFIDKIILHITSKNELKMIQHDKRNFIINIVKELFKIILKELNKYTYQKYKKNNIYKIDINVINFISEKFKRDIYIIDSKTRMPCVEFLEKENIKNTNSIIILSHNNQKYEIVGKLLPGNKIKREFESDDEIIDKIKTFVFHPELIEEKYPELTDYISSEYKKSNKSDSDSDSDYEYEVNDSEQGDTSEKAGDNNDTSEKAGDNNDTSEQAGDNNDTSEQAGDNNDTSEKAGDNNDTSEKSGDLGGAAGGGARRGSGGGGGARGAGDNNDTSEQAGDNNDTSEQAGDNNDTSEQVGDNNDTS